MFLKKSYTINNLTITNEMLAAYITKFWLDVFKNIKDTNHLMLMCKVKFLDNELGYRTLGKLRIVNYSDKYLLNEYLTDKLGLLNDAYTTHPISDITFSYIIKEGFAADNRKLLKDLSDSSITSHKFFNLNIPITMVPSEFGIVVTKPALYETFTRYIVNFNNRLFQIDISLDNLVNKVAVLGASDLKWTDTKISEGFKREIGKSTLYFVDGNLVLRKQQLNAKPFSKLSVDKSLQSRIVTMDIETIKVDSKISPYLISGYNGNSYITSYANSSMDQKALFTSFIDQLLTFFSKGSNNLIVYAHNLSSFDGIFLLKHLLSYGKVEPLIFNGKLMCIKVRLNNGKTLVFKDSFLILPLSLRKLCLAFNIILSKSYFPFKLNDIFYSGLLPKFAYWVGISLNDYESLVTKFTGKVWSFKDEAIKYCHLDCQCLHEILTKFNELIFNEFQINVNNSTTLTLPSLAMRIYRTHFMPKNTIYQILGKVEKAIRLSYTGGAVDVYIPHNRIGSFLYPVRAMFKKLWSYDVNSLYPTVMATHPMPIGLPIYFEGNIRRFDPNAFGFFYCKITSPDNLLHPILQRKIKTNEGMRTIAGLGSWTGWIFSGEMDNAMKFGYTFEILNGYQFNKGDLFSGYVNKLFNLRLQFAKGHPLNLIAKLLLNSLYGKFGMKTDITKVEMFDISTKVGLAKLEKAINLYKEGIECSIRIDNTIIIVRDSLLDLISNNDADSYHGPNVNIAIASAITSAARIFMSIFKNNPAFRLFYSDTDNIVIDAPLPDSLVGKELGQFKLEYIIKKAVFLAPKVYGLITDTGEEVMKVKGLTPEVVSGLHVNDLEYLLIKDSTKELTQAKWFKKTIEGEISVNDVAYTLKVTSNKREAIYVDGIFQDTVPYNYEEIIKK